MISYFFLFLTPEKNTYVVSSLLALLKIVVASQYKLQGKKCLSRLADAHALYYANELLVRVRLVF